MPPQNTLTFFFYPFIFASTKLKPFEPSQTLKGEGIINHKQREMKTSKSVILLLVIFVVAGINGFGQMKMNKTPIKPPQAKIEKAICVLYPTQGNNVSGTITFMQTDNGVKVVADIQGLAKGKHGFHIHQFGDCSSPDGMAAGGHFNPENKAHGGPMDMTRHMGDMGNVEADEAGKAHLEYVDNTIKLNGPESIIGKSVIVHKGEDDLKSQPVGNAGPRVACGVIGVAK
jgi:superoxide dismutase, Cu-Zn family